MKKLLVLMISWAALISCSGSNTRSDIHPPREGDLSYRALMLKDYDDMSKAVRKHLRTAQNELKSADGEDADSLEPGIQELKQALKLIFSRPNSDNMVAKLTPDVRRELVHYDAYGKAIRSLAREGIQAFDKKLGVATVTLSTYTFMLDNLMAEIQPEVRDNQELRSVVQMIADAKLVMPRDVINERKLSGMFSSESPSEKALKILKRTEPEKK